MIGTRILGPALALLLLAAGAALAQPDAGATTTPAPARQPAAGADTGTAADGKDQAPGPPAEAGKSPSDYRASEEISEDLPVSFPVDI